MPGILRLAKPYGARTYVDEAHGIGVLGRTGAGAAGHLGVLDEVDIVMGTFSKSLASVGGFIASERGGGSLCKALLEEGIYTNPVLRPAAAQNLLRISCTAMAHTEAHVERLVNTLDRVANGLGIA